MKMRKNSTLPYKLKYAPQIVVPVLRLYTYW